MDWRLGIVTVATLRYIVHRFTATASKSPTGLSTEIDQLILNLCVNAKDLEQPIRKEEQSWRTYPIASKPSQKLQCSR